MLHIPYLIIRLYFFFIRVISLTTDKMVTSLARIMERTTYLSIISHTLWIFEECKKSEANFIANRSFTTCYNSNILMQIMGIHMLISLNFASKGTIFPSLKADKSAKCIIVESKPEMVYLQEVVPYTFLSGRF